MSVNNYLKSIKLKEVLIVIVVLYVIWFVLNKFVFNIPQKFIYLFIFIYFLFKLRNSSDVGQSISEIFTKISLKYLLLIVVLNIFFSYGMLYLAQALSGYFGFLTNNLISNSLIAALGGFISIVVISPVVEELLFRGIFINKFKLVVPATFAVLISALLFGALHNYGSIISAFVFAICMSILYLKTDNIFVPVFAHFLNNLIAEIISHLDSSNILFTNSLVMTIISFLAIISFFLIMLSIKIEWVNIK